jgi:hypothetical protein
MIGIKSIVSIAAFAAVIGVSSLTSAVADDSIPGDKSLIQSQGASVGASEVPRSPIRVNTIDYPDTGPDAGKLKLAGTGMAGNPLYIYLDNQPLVKVMPDSQGDWSVQVETNLKEGVHRLSAEQYDPTTRILAGRAMISFQSGKPGEEGTLPPQTKQP